MPLPILAVLGAVAGIVGAGGHLSAKETNEQAQRKMQEAQELYDGAKLSLETAKNETEKALLTLGYSKRGVLNSSMKEFLNSYEKIKHIQVTQSVGLNEISQFNVNKEDVLELKEMTNIYSSAITSGATGAAAGSLVALAASGSLSLVTGGLSLAGSTLAAGEVGIAAGIAGTSISTGLALTPLAAIVAPVVLFTGLSASMKADENLEKARAVYAEAEAATEKMKVSETLCNAITERSEMFDDLLKNLNEMFRESTGLMVAVIRKKEGKILKKELSSTDFSNDELKLIAVTRSLAGAIKAVIDTPILSGEGQISDESTKIYSSTSESLPEFEQAIDAVKKIDYKVKPARISNLNLHNSGLRAEPSLDLTVWKNIRNILSLVIGIALSVMFASKIALFITIENSKIWFLDELLLNKVAFYILFLTSSLMLVGKLNSTTVEEYCRKASGVALGIFYFQYCKSVEQMEHYIIFSIAFLFIFAMIYSYLDARKDKWVSAEYFSERFLCIGTYPILFFMYIFCCGVIGIPEGFCLTVTAFLVFAMGITKQNSTVK